jgi:NADH:ubiquinone oxidoreductase subunit 4 (subunit M)
MGRVANAYSLSLGVVIAFPVLEVLLVIVRLQRKGNYVDIFDLAIVLAALTVMWFLFRQFAHQRARDLKDVDAWRRLVLPVWRIAVCGAAGLMVAMQLAMRHLS